MGFRNRIVRLSQLIVDVLRTDTPPNPRWELVSNVVDQFGNKGGTLYAYTGDPAELAPGGLTVLEVNNGPTHNAGLIARAPRIQGAQAPELGLTQSIAGRGVAYLRTGPDFSTDVALTFDTGDAAQQVAVLEGTGVAGDKAVIRGFPGGIFFGSAQQCFTGNEPALVGAAPPLGTPKLMQQQSAVLTIANGQGGGTIPFPTTFPNGLVSLVATIGDPSGNPTQMRVGAYALGSFVVATWTPTGAFVANGTLIRINYVAIGW